MAEARVIAADPFALMMNPQAVFQAMEESSRLRRLTRHVCRPLDKPLIPTKGEGGAADAFDREIDDAGDESVADA
jgi:hypothetical protein